MHDSLPKEQVLDALRRIDPYTFEDIVAEVWENQGYDTKVRDGSGDRGIDVVATKAAKKELLQVKRYSSSNKIGSREVRRYATLYPQVDDATQVIIITSGFYTDEARQLGRDLDVELIDGDKIFKLIEKHTPNIAVKALDGEYPTDPTHTDTHHPFENPERFQRISEEQGIFESCPECVRGHIWLGQLKNNRIRLKCERCGSEWKEERKEDGWWIFGRKKTVGWIQV